MTLFSFELVAGILPILLDKIPFAHPYIQTDFVFSPRHFLVEMLVIYLIILTIHIMSFWLAKWLLNISLRYLLVCTFTASFLGFWLSLSPIANEFVWSAIIKFHLKQGGDTGIDFTVRWLLNIFTIITGSGAAFLLMLASSFYSRLQRSAVK